MTKKRESFNFAQLIWRTHERVAREIAESFIREINLVKSTDLEDYEACANVIARKEEGFGPEARFMSHEDSCYVYEHDHKLDRPYSHTYAWLVFREDLPDGVFDLDDHHSNQHGYSFMDDIRRFLSEDEELSDQVWKLTLTDHGMIELYILCSWHPTEEELEEMERDRPLEDDEEDMSNMIALSYVQTRKRTEDSWTTEHHFARDGRSLPKKDRVSELERVEVAEDHEILFDLKEEKIASYDHIPDGVEGLN